MRPDRRLPLIAIACVAIGVVVGFLLGGVGPRLEVAERDETIADLEERLAEADTGGWRSPVPGFDRILRAPEEERPLPPIARGPDGEPDEPGRDGPREREAVAYDDGGVPPPRWRDDWRQDSPGDRLTAFRRAASIQRVRRLQSRAALGQQADLSPEEMVEVDAALTEMNAALLGHGEELILLAMSDEPPAAADLLGITHDVTGILHDAQLRLEGIVGPERLGDVDPSAIEIWNHVDLAQLEPAAQRAMRGP
ncbi:MAG: hypothetical protein H6719_38635 [Sandaracinaceae bacterium]|nr:hypothetical protein [Sandaracinaceae bacterium]